MKTRPDATKLSFGTAEKINRKAKRKAKSLGCAPDMLLLEANKRRKSRKARKMANQSRNVMFRLRREAK